MSRNPYHAEDGKPVLKPSVFVFIDVLGYTDLIASAERNNSQVALLGRLHEALFEGRKILDDRASLSIDHTLRGAKDLYVLKAFTDNIVIAVPIRHGDAEVELGSLFFKLGYFQLAMSLKGFFIRGAVSVGNACVDDVTVFGEALTQAYLGESTQARDPRIIFTESAVAAVKKHLAYYGCSDFAPQADHILCDADGQWFLNYLDCILVAENEVGPYVEELLQHKEAVERKLEEFQSNPPIFSKYAWVANYHNYFCDLHDRHFSNEHKIDSELFRAKPRSIVRSKRSA